LKFAAVCCVLVAVGLFVIPHDVAPRELLFEAVDSTSENHSQTLYGLIIIIGGIIGAIVGVVLGSSKQTEPA
jgi:hypothetical protein